MDTIRLTVYGHAKPAGSKNPRVTKTGKLYVHDSSGKQGTEWRQQIQQHAGAAMNGHPLLTGPLKLHATFHLPRPKSHYRTNGQVRPNAPGWPAVRPDVGKLERAVLDALTGTCYRDDAQVVDLHVTKTYGEPARAEIGIWKL